MDPRRGISLYGPLSNVICLQRHSGIQGFSESAFVCLFFLTFFMTCFLTSRYPWVSIFFLWRILMFAFPNFAIRIPYLKLRFHLFFNFEIKTIAFISSLRSFHLLLCLSSAKTCIFENLLREFAALSHHCRSAGLDMSFADFYLQ